MTPCVPCKFVVCHTLILQVTWYRQHDERLCFHIIDQRTARHWKARTTMNGMTTPAMIFIITCHMWSRVNFFVWSHDVYRPYKVELVVSREFKGVWWCTLTLGEMGWELVCGGGAGAYMLAFVRPFVRRSILYHVYPLICDEVVKPYVNSCKHMNLCAMVL